MEPQQGCRPSVYISHVFTGSNLLAQAKRQRILHQPPSRTIPAAHRKAHLIRSLKGTDNSRQTTYFSMSRSCW